MLTYKIVLYRQKTYKDKTHPVMLQTMENRKAKRISLHISCKQNEWDSARSRFKKPFPNHEVRNAELSATESRADLIIANARLNKKVLTVEGFLLEFTDKKVTHDVFSFFDERRAEMQAQGKAGNRFVYGCTLNAVKLFHKEKTLSFEQVDYSFLKKFEAHLRTKGNNDGGISLHMRIVRSVYNEAIRRGIVDRERYPFTTQFNKNGYSISHLKSEYTARALSEIDLEKIKTFNIQLLPKIEWVFDMFLFSYYCRGMSFADMAHLQKGNIYDGRLRYARKKSKSKLTMKLHSIALEVIEKYRTESNFLFPILSEFHQKPQQQLDRIIKKRKQFNTGLKEIASLLGIEADLTSYVSRHSFSMHLKRQGVSTGVISQALGHEDEATTRFYLAQFGDDIVDETNDLL